MEIPWDFNDFWKVHNVQWEKEVEEKIWWIYDRVEYDRK